MPYDGFGARINAHYPIPTYYPGTLEQPAEITVYCACGQYEYFSQASIGGGCDTDWHDDYEKHLQEVDA